MSTTEQHPSDSAVVAAEVPVEVRPEKVQLSAEEQAAADRRRTRNLTISFLLMIFFGLGNKVFQVLQFQPMYNYPLFNNMLTTFVYIPVSFAYIIPVLKYGSAITKEAQEVPKMKFAVMGILDSIAGLMQSLSVNYIANGGLVILLSQANIPVSMLVSRLLLKTKYKRSQILGAIVVALGIMTVLLPKLLNPPASDDDSSAPSSTTVLAWAIVMIFSAVPQCLSSVYKEIALGDTELDVVYLNGWIAVFQFIAAIPLLLPSAPASNLAIRDIDTNLWNGLKCYGGINSIMDGDHPDKCSTAPLYVTLYLFFNLGYNVLIILILKYGSSNLLWLALTIMVPLGNIAFALDFMPDHKPLRWTDIFGLVVIMAGLLTFRFWSKFFKSFLSKTRCYLGLAQCLHLPLPSSSHAPLDGSLNAPLMAGEVSTGANSEDEVSDAQAEADEARIDVEGAHTHGAEAALLVAPDSPFLGRPGSESSSMPAAPSTPALGVHGAVRPKNKGKKSARAGGH